MAHYRVDPGAPVRLSEVAVELAGQGQTDPELRAVLAAFPLKPGDVADHRRYEDGKTRLRRRALSTGYLDATFDPAELRVDPAAGTAAARLTLNTGPRYTFGPVRLEQDILDPAFLARFVPFAPGDFYNVRELLDLQYALDDTEYFSRVEVVPHPEQAVDGAVPIEVALDPNQRHKYTFGIGYGTDTGPRGTLGWDNRRVNSLGHRWRSQLKLAQVDASAQFSYLIPIDNPATDSLDLNGGLRETRVEDRTSRITSVGIARNDRDPPWQRNLRLNLEHESFELADGGEDEQLLSLLPGANWTYTRADDPVYPRDGLRWSLDLLGSVSPDASPFAQALSETRWVHPPAAAAAGSCASRPAPRWPISCPTCLCRSDFSPAVTTVCAATPFRNWGPETPRAKSRAGVIWSPPAPNSSRCSGGSGAQPCSSIRATRSTTAPWI